MSVERSSDPPPVDLNALSSAEQEKCEECGIKSATLKCLQCVGLYCDNCFKTAHAASKSMNRHTPVAVAKVKCLLKGCPVHPEETAKLYCEDDEMVVCSECCRIGEHIGHSVLPFAEVAERHFVKLKGQIPSCVNSLKRLNDMEQAMWERLTEVRKDFHVRSAEIATAFTGLFVHLQRRELLLLEELMKASDSCTSQLVDDIKQVHGQAGCLAAMLSTVQSGLASGSVEVVLRGAQWSSELSGLCEVTWENKVELHPISFKIDKKSYKKSSLKNTTANMTTPALPVPSPLLVAHNEPGSLTSFNSQAGEEEEPLAHVPCVTLQETTQDARQDVPLLQANLHHIDCKTPPKRGPQTLEDHCTIETSPQIETTPRRPNLSHSPSSPQPKNPTVSWESAEPVTVIHVVDPLEFYIQRSGDQRTLQALTAKLDEYCPSQKHPHLRTLTHGEVYACRNSDGHWYRARLDRIIRGVSQVSVLVVYTDLGCNGMTNREGITTLPSELASGQYLCTKCSLAEVAPTPKFNNVAPKSWTQQCLNQFKSMVLDNPNVRMKVVYSDGDVLCVDLLLPPTHSPISVIGRLTRMGHVASRKKAVKPRPCYPPPCFSLRPGEEVEVVVSSTDSPSSFFVQLVDACQAITDLCNQLQTEVATIQPSRLVDGTIGSLCLAIYSGDGLYYRAEIVAMNDKEAQVLFIDYGNRDAVPMETLLTLPLHYLDVPVQAIQCTLSDVISLDPNGMWSDEVSDTFSNMISESVYVLVVEGKGTPLPVSLKNAQTLEPVSQAAPPTHPPLSISSTNLSSSAITSLLPLQDSPSAVTISPPILPSIGTHFTGTVTHIASLLDFHVVMDTQQLEQLKFSLMLHTPLAPSHAPLHPGDHCLAHFTDQELWYRVRVESLVEELCVVKYVDYGNVATISKEDTAPLPEECAKLPAQAIPCRLSNVVGGANGWDHLVGQDSKWDAASLPVHLFSSFVMDQVVTVTVEWFHQSVSAFVGLQFGIFGSVSNSWRWS
eukprot:Em0011g41a